MNSLLPAVAPEGAAEPPEQDGGGPGAGGDHRLHPQPRGRLHPGRPRPAGPAVGAALDRDGAEAAAAGHHVPSAAVLPGHGGGGGLAERAGAAHDERGEGKGRLFIGV